MGPKKGRNTTWTERQDGSRSNREWRGHDLFTYLTQCNELLNNDAFESPEMRQLFIAQVAGEIKGKEQQCAADQRCSRILEKILELDIEENALEEWIRTFLAPEAFLEMSYNLYSSHVIQTLLGRAAGIQMKREEPWEVLEKILNDLFDYLDENKSWEYLFYDASATHVVRSLLLMLSGYMSERTTVKRGSKKSKTGKKKEETLPSLRFPEMLFSELFGRLTKSIVTCLDQESKLSLEVYGAPIVRLVFLILADRDEEDALIVSLKKLIVTQEDLNALASSGVGSHVLEAAIQVAPDSEFLRLFQFFRKKWKEVLECSPGGVFAVQAIVKKLQDTPQLGLALDEFPVEECLTGQPHQQAIVVSLLESCIRIRSHFKEVAMKIFVTLDIKDSANYRHAWPRLLRLDKTASAADLKEESVTENTEVTETKEETEAVGEDKKKEGDRNDWSETKTQDWWKSKSSKTPLVSWTGADLAIQLIQFPPDAIAPLVNSFKTLRTLAPIIASESSGCRVLEKCLALKSCLDRGERLKIIRRLLRDKAAVIKLACGRGTGWLVSAMYTASASDPKLREELTKILIEEEEQVRDKNIAIWRACECYAYKKSKDDEWAEKQQKVSKTQKLFDDILGDTGPSEKKISEEDKMDVDPKPEEPATVTALPREDAKGIADVDKVDAEAALEIDNLFWFKPRRRGRRVNEEDAALPQVSSIPAVEDKNLDAIMSILGGQFGKKKKKRARSPEKENKEEDSSSEEEEKNKEQKMPKLKKEKKKRKFMA